MVCGEDDLPFIPRFMASHTVYPLQGIPLHAVVPDSAVEATNSSQPGFESVWPHSKFASPSGAPQSTDGHQIERLKLRFAAQDMFDNYLMLDARTVAVRAASIDDFLDATGNPYRIVTRTAENRVDPQRWFGKEQRFESALHTVLPLLGLPSSDYPLCWRENGVLSSSVAVSLQELLNSQQSLGDNTAVWDLGALALHDLWRDQIAEGEVTGKDDPFFSVDYPGERFSLALRGANTQALARGYVAVVGSEIPVGEDGQVDFTESLSTLISGSVSGGTIRKALGERLLRRAPRVRKVLGF